MKPKKMVFVLYHCACQNKWDNNRMSGTQLNKCSNMPRRKKRKIKNFGEYIYFFTIYVEKDANVSYAEFFITIFFLHRFIYGFYNFGHVFTENSHTRLRFRLLHKYKYTLCYFFFITLYSCYLIADFTVLFWYPSWQYNI